MLFCFIFYLIYLICFSHNVGTGGTSLHSWLYKTASWNDNEGNSDSNSNRFLHFFVFVCFVYFVLVVGSDPYVQPVTIQCHLHQWLHSFTISISHSKTASPIVPLTLEKLLYWRKNLKDSVETFLWTTVVVLGYGLLKALPSIVTASQLLK